MGKIKQYIAATRGSNNGSHMNISNGNKNYLLLVPKVVKGKAKYKGNKK